MELKRRLITVLLTAALVLSFPMALMADTEGGSGTADPYTDFVESCCEVQTPEAKDDYVSAIVKMPTAGSPVTAEMIADDLEVIVDMGTEQYKTTPSLEEKDNGNYFVFTTGKMPALAEGETVSVSFSLDTYDGNHADKTVVSTVGPAFRNSAYARKAVKPTIKLSKTAYTYSGKYNKPAVTVNASYNGVRINPAAFSYTAEYTNCKNVGKATVKITLTGDYSGTATATFKVNPKGTSMVSVKPLKKGFTAKWNKQGTKMTATKRVDGYQIQYSTNKNFKSGNKTATAKKFKTVTKKVTKLKAKKVYYVRVRTYLSVNGTKYWSGWSAAKKVKTK